MLEEPADQFWFLSFDLEMPNILTAFFLYNGRMFDYEMIALVRSNHIYIQKKITSESFRGAFYELLKDDKSYLPLVMDIYCRKSNGDYKLMGHYDGMSAVAENGEYRSHILKTTDGNTYMLSDDGFVSVN